jgi:hypothetical protein
MSTSSGCGDARFVSSSPRLLPSYDDRSSLNDASAIDFIRVSLTIMYLTMLDCCLLTYSSFGMMLTLDRCSPAHELPVCLSGIALEDDDFSRCLRRALKRPIEASDFSSIGIKTP